MIFHYVYDQTTMLILAVFGKALHDNAMQKLEQLQQKAVGTNSKPKLQTLDLDTRLSVGEQMPITGTTNHDESWEKQHVFDLNNGFTVTVEYNSHYGDMVSRIDNCKVLDYPDSMVWHCSNGLGGLPQWAEPWIETVNQTAQTKLVRPNFKKVYDTTPA